MFKLTNLDAFVLYDNSYEDRHMYALKYVLPTIKDNRYHLRINFLKNKQRYIITISSIIREDILKVVKKMPIISWVDTTIMDKWNNNTTIGNNYRFIIKKYFTIQCLLINIQSYKLNGSDLSNNCKIYFSKCIHDKKNSRKLFTMFYDTFFKKWILVHKKWYSKKENPFTDKDLIINN